MLKLFFAPIQVNLNQRSYLIFHFIDLSGLEFEAQIGKRIRVKTTKINGPELFF